VAGGGARKKTGRGTGIVFADAMYDKKYDPKPRAGLIGEKAALLLATPTHSSTFTP
jgi:hypothetical protein